MAARPRLAVVKFASCDGCQLTLLDCEDELLTVAGAVEISHFAEASSDLRPGPYDVALVEGSITTREDLGRLLRIRGDSKYLITIGACATAGGIQALRNFADHEEFMRAVYARPEMIETLATSTPIGAHVKVDFELRLSDRQTTVAGSSCLHARGPSTAHFQRVRLRRMQATRQRLRRRGSRCGLPGPGNANRLRCTLPDLHARLLRLLRAVDATEHARFFGPATSRQTAAGRRGSFAAQFQWLRAGFPRGE